MTSSLSLMAAEAPAEKFVVQYFIHIVGCAKEEELFIFVKGEDGKTRMKHFNESNYPAEADIVVVLKGVVGFQRKLTCPVGT
jgi:hypothetical protein